MEGIELHVQDTFNLRFDTDDKLNVQADRNRREDYDLPNKDVD